MVWSGRGLEGRGLGDVMACHVWQEGPVDSSA